jgi:hypothetical protein
MTLAERVDASVAWGHSRSHVELERHVQCIEEREGIVLPPSYKQFLLEYDGCPNLFRGAPLFSVDQLLDPTQTHAVNIALEDLNTPIPSFVAPVKPHWRDENMLCIGMDSQGSIVFVLDPSSIHDDGEMDVIAWFSGLGMRFPCFAEMLEFIADMLDVRGNRRRSDLERREVEREAAA